MSRKQFIFHKIRRNYLEVFAFIWLHNKFCVFLFLCFDKLKDFYRLYNLTSGSHRRKFIKVTDGEASYTVSSHHTHNWSRGSAVLAQRLQLSAGIKPIGGGFPACPKAGNPSKHASNLTRAGGKTFCPTWSLKINLSRPWNVLDHIRPWHLVDVVLPTQLSVSPSHGACWVDSSISEKSQHSCPYPWRRAEGRRKGRIGPAG